MKAVRSAPYAMSDAEWQTRCDLAACYRLVAMMGWDDLLATHISARLPDEDGRELFLLNPYGWLFEEITASSLVKIDAAGEIVGDSVHKVNRAGFVIHSAVHMARADAGCVMHLHTLDGVAVSGVEGGLLPLNQTAMLINAQVAFHEFEGVAVDTDERQRLARDLGTKDLMLLRNHGTLAVGRDIADCFNKMYFFERSCSVQVRTCGMNLPLHPAPPAAIAKANTFMEVSSPDYAAKYLWPAMLRRLDRQLPGYDS
ncbi:MAG: class II aldolase/adducin family protein [Sphingomonadaceae bacterium]|nr:class II aldolase/adducin family protein [Sphingomonadaceae bacterium]